MLATYSFLPILQAFCKPCGIEFDARDISLASRILAQFPEYLDEDQRIEDHLAYLGQLSKSPDANIIKLPNISASVPQLNSAIKELQNQGYKIPNYPINPGNELENRIKSKYSKVLGSAVNPVLRKGNSDRRCAKSVKEYVRINPHKFNTDWSKDSMTHVASMKNGDFYSSELSTFVKSDGKLKIVLIDKLGNKHVLKENIELEKNELIDASRMSINHLINFLTDEIHSAKNEKLLFSLHLKTTMMKISDPIIFGHCVSIYYKDLLQKYHEVFKYLGINPNNGIGNVMDKLKSLPETLQNSIRSDINSIQSENARLAMVDSDRGITNLHNPSDIIIDASMPSMIRSSGKMYGADGELYDTKAVIPDRSYASVYHETIEFHKKNGKFDPVTMGSVANVGLMANKAEEYGSHDKTFEVTTAGHICVMDEDNNILLTHDVQEGDIWRMCQTKDSAIKDWVQLAVKRGLIQKNPVVFWLDNDRAHDRNLILKVNEYLKELDTDRIDIRMMSPKEATKFTLKEIKEGRDVISVTGNVLRDYLTDLFPILELGTSAKMLSIVPLLGGGGLYETGAGGTAPKHVQQLEKENHLRWDSLGEFLALAASFDDLAKKTHDAKIRIMAETLDAANAKFLKENKSPKRMSGQLDVRGSHFYLSMYWAESLSNQNEDIDLANYFKPIYEEILMNEAKIIEELNSNQGKSINLGGYYNPNVSEVNQIMRPSIKFNMIINNSE